MSTHINALRIRKVLGRDRFHAPQQFGPDGWLFDADDTRVIVTCSEVADSPVQWVHASISHPDTMPSYDELATLHRAVWPNGYAHQLFVPRSAHVNIHEFALHLWGRLDGRRVLPDFGAQGSI